MILLVKIYEIYWINGIENAAFDLYLEKRCIQFQSICEFCEYQRMFSWQTFNESWQNLHPMQQSRKSIHLMRHFLFFFSSLSSLLFVYFGVFYSFLYVNLSTHENVCVIEFSCWFHFECEFCRACFATL